jgi:predicted permease
MGVPLLIALLGAAASGPAILTILVDLVITSSLCIALSRLDSADEHGASEAAKKALQGVAMNPMPWAIVLGGVSSALQLQPWKPIAQTIGLLADAASPVALFTIGAVLARSQIVAAAEEHGPMPVRDYLPVSVAKLLLHPVLVFGAGSAAIALGVPLHRDSLVVMTLVAALPSASNVSLLAERFGADNGRIARIILLTTSAAFLTFSAAVALLR